VPPITGAEARALFADLREGDESPQRADDDLKFWCAHIRGGCPMAVSGPISDAESTRGFSLSRRVWMCSALGQLVPWRKRSYSVRRVDSNARIHGIASSRRGNARTG